MSHANPRTQISSTNVLFSKTRTNSCAPSPYRHRAVKIARKTDNPKVQHANRVMVDPLSPRNVSGRAINGFPPGVPSRSLGCSIPSIQLESEIAIESQLPWACAFRRGRRSRSRDFARITENTRARLARGRTHAKPQRQFITGGTAILCRFAMAEFPQPQDRGAVRREVPLAFAGVNIRLRNHIAQHIEQVPVSPIVALQNGPQRNNRFIQLRVGPRALGLRRPICQPFHIRAIRIRSSFKTARRQLHHASIAHLPREPAVNAQLGPVPAIASSLEAFWRKMPEHMDLKMDYGV